MTTTQVDNFDAKYDSLLKGDYVKTIANGLDFFVGEPPKDLDKTRKSFFEIIDVRAGDVKLMWDRTKADEVEAAQSTFDKLIKKGYAAFLVKDNDGNKGEKITKFDPNAERIIMISPIAGG
jgi:hypothetical protein